MENLLLVSSYLHRRSYVGGSALALWLLSWIDHRYINLPQLLLSLVYVGVATVMKRNPWFMRGCILFHLINPIPWFQRSQIHRSLQQHVECT